MSERAYRCCECCKAEALDDHVGHGGHVEADQHEVPCLWCGTKPTPTPAPVRDDAGGLG